MGSRSPGLADFWAFILTGLRKKKRGRLGGERRWGDEEGEVDFELSEIGIRVAGS